MNIKDVNAMAEYRDAFTHIIMYNREATNHLYAIHRVDASGDFYNGLYYTSSVDAYIKFRELVNTYGGAK